MRALNLSPSALSCQSTSKRLLVIKDGGILAKKQTSSFSSGNSYKTDPLIITEETKVIDSIFALPRFNMMNKGVTNSNSKTQAS